MLETTQNIRTIMLTCDSLELTMAILYFFTNHLIINSKNVYKCKRTNNNIDRNLWPHKTIN